MPTARIAVASAARRPQSDTGQNRRIVVSGFFGLQIFSTALVYRESSRMAWRSNRPFFSTKTSTRKTPLPRGPLVPIQ